MSLSDNITYKACFFLALPTQHYRIKTNSLSGQSYNFLKLVICEALNGSIVLFISFEFVKAVGNTLTKVRLAENQELDGRTIKHVAGSGPIYIRAVRNLQSSETDMSENEWVSIGK